MNIADIHSPADIKGKSTEELTQIAIDLRKALITKLARHGGHVGPNLGFLEATIALHYVFDAPGDKIVFDVSHQSYVHKMLTGRIGAFLDPAHYDDVTGYTNPKESPYDLFSVGHTSTSVSLASGLAKARDLRHEHYNVVAVIGDGSLTGGQAFEGLDYASVAGTNFIVVVNDNQMSIAPDHSALTDNLTALRLSNGTAPDNYFKALGYKYIYVKRGNNLDDLIEAFHEVKDYNGPVVVHLNTEKGMGLPVAEEYKEKFHFSGPFDPATGTVAGESDAPTYIGMFADFALRKMKADREVVTITAAVPGAVGFGPALRYEADDQFVDVGIAEEQAVSMAAGLAKEGMKPIVAEPATFLQRAYDQLSQDVAINNLPATFVTFYGGVWGMNDETHLGFFDVPMISDIPGILFLAPTCAEEYLAMLEWAVEQHDTPVVVRTPGGPVVNRSGDFAVDYTKVGYETVRPGRDVAIIAAGSFLEMGLEAARLMSADGLDPMVINPRYMSRLDTATLDSLRDFRLVITLEDNSIDGGLGQKIAAYLGDAPVAVKCLGLPKAFPDRYHAADLLSARGLTPAAIARLAKA